MDAVDFAILSMVFAGISVALALLALVASIAVARGRRR